MFIIFRMEQLLFILFTKRYTRIIFIMKRNIFFYQLTATRIFYTQTVDTY
jgi:hypothetical protein